jgi:hypothetical protein
MYSVRRWTAVGICGLGLLLGTMPAFAELAGPHPKNLRDREVIKTAYHEPTDTYFQLASDIVDKTGTGKWAYAVAKARNAQFKGRQGQLAKIDSPELHRWFLETFDLRELSGNYGIWIGLRYWCGVRVLTWATGDEHKSSAFAPWDTPWYGGDVRCGRNNIPYMGVYYSQSSKRWKAIGYMKRFRYYLIEFPPKKQSADAKTDER